MKLELHKARNDHFIAIKTNFEFTLVVIHIKIELKLN